MIAHDPHSMRIWAKQPISVRTQPIYEHLLTAFTARPYFMSPVAGTPDGRLMVLVRSSSVFLWRAEAYKSLIPVIPPPPRVASEPAAGSGTRRAGASAADGSSPRFRTSQIAPGGDRLYLIDQEGKLRVWSLQGTQDGSSVQARELDWALPVVDGGFTNLALRSDGSVLAVSDRSETVTLIDTVRTRVLGQIPHPSGDSEAFMLAMAFSPDGRQLAVGSQQGTIALWSVEHPTRPRLRFHLPGHRGFVTSLVFDAQGRRLAARPARGWIRWSRSGTSNSSSASSPSWACRIEFCRQDL